MYSSTGKSWPKKTVLPAGRAGAGIYNYCYSCAAGWKLGYPAVERAGTHAFLEWQEKSVSHLRIAFLSADAAGLFQLTA